MRDVFNTQHLKDEEGKGHARGAQGIRILFHSKNPKNKTMLPACCGLESTLNALKQDAAVKKLPVIGNTDKLRTNCKYRVTDTTAEL